MKLGMMHGNIGPKERKKEGREDEVHSLNITESIVWRFFDVDDQVLKEKKKLFFKTGWDR